MSEADRHTVAIDGGWLLWRDHEIRSAGFPASLVARLADGELVALVDRLRDAERREASAKAQAVEQLKAQRRTDDATVRKRASATLARVLAGRSAEVIAQAGTAAAAVDAHARSLTECKDARGAVDVRFRDAVERSRGVLREIAGLPLFREAVLWQNRGAVTRGIDSLLRHGADESSSALRQQERLVASYIQRYCTKNETIGFFGPVCWGTFADATGIAQQHGPALVSARETYFEYWSIDALASALTQDVELLPDLVPRRAPTTFVDGTTLHHPIDRRMTLSPLFAAVLSACDGTRRARDIAADLAARPELELAGSEEVLELLGSLAEQGLLTWTIEVPTSELYPERYVRELLASAGSPAAARALARLDGLDAGRKEVARAAGQPVELAAALERLDATFERVTGERATRNAGKIHAGRTVVYEECLRDLQVSIGHPFLDRVGSALSLVLDGTRWFTHQLATRYRHALSETYDRVAASQPGAPVDYLRFWQQATSLFPASGPNALVQAVSEEVRRRWLAILAFDPAERRIERSSAHLRSAVREAFAAADPGFLGARNHTVDIMIAAGPSGGQANDYVAVLGEIAAGINLLAWPISVERHREPAEVARWFDADRIEVGVAPVTGKQVFTRGTPVSISPRDIDVEIGDTRSGRDRSKVLAVGELVVEPFEGHLTVRDRNGRYRFEVLTFLERYLIAAYEQAGGNPLLPELEHRPRITIDGLIICREQWRLRAEDVSPIAGNRGIEQFLATRAWAAARGFPRWLFVSIPEERKPVYVDLASPISVELLGKLAAKASRMTVTEMVPDLEQLWLGDAQGECYTSELRIAAVDPRPWRSPWSTRTEASDV